MGGCGTAAGSVTTVVCCKSCTSDAISGISKKEAASVGQPLSLPGRSVAAASGEGEVFTRTNASTSSSASMGPGVGMSAEEKELEKTRLQRLVKDFAREAITGIAVCVVHPIT